MLCVLCLEIVIKHLSFFLWVQGIPSLNIDTADKEQKAYNSLMTWLNTEAQEVLATSQEPIQDRDSEFLVRKFDIP